MKREIKPTLKPVNEGFVKEDDFYHKGDGNFDDIIENIKITSKEQFEELVDKFVKELKEEGLKQFRKKGTRCIQYLILADKNNIMQDDVEDPSKVGQTVWLFKDLDEDMSTFGDGFSDIEEEELENIRPITESSEPIVHPDWIQVG